MLGAKPKKQRPENYQNGRERPHFFGFQPPKKIVGSLPPAQQDATVALSRPQMEERISSKTHIATAIFHRWQG